MAKNKALAADQLLKSGLKLIGAKVGQTKFSGRKKIYLCEPPGVSTYVEPFLGSGSVLVGKRHHIDEVAGDVNPYVINFYQQMQERPQDLLERLLDGVKRMEAGEAEYFHDIRSNPPESGALDRAVWYYLVNKYCFNGIVRFNNAGECNSTYCSTVKGRGIYDQDWYWQVVDRVQGVHFFNEGYASLLSYANGGHLARKLVKPDPKNTWVVLDPPYFEVFTKYNRVSFNPTDHLKLAETLKQAKYKWLLTINDRPEVRELYKHCNLLEHEIFYSCSQTAAGRGQNKELIVTNYDVCKTKLEKFSSLMLETSSVSSKS